MTKPSLGHSISWLSSALTILCVLGSGLRAEDTPPPQVSIAWPRDGYSFGAINTAIKIKVNGSSAIGTSVTQVQFYVESDLIGTVTNAPFNLVWQVYLPGIDYGDFNLRAVALDSLGKRAESQPVNFHYSITQPTFPVVDMLGPRNGSVFSAPATFDFSAEVLASEGDAGPVEFFVDDNSVGVVDGSESLRVTTPPASLVVSNLTEGVHRLRVGYLGVGGGGCFCNWVTNTIRVVRLELRSPRLTPEARLECEVFASLPGIKTIVQMSSDRLFWAPVITNRPPGTSFTFTDTYPATNVQRFYRVALAPQ
jgi:hypothetical protein